MSNEDEAEGQPNLRAVADAIDGAEVVRDEDLVAPRKRGDELPASTVPLDPDPGEANAFGTHPGAWLPNRLGLPDDCPVTPLGVDGQKFWFLDTIGQLQCLAAKDFGQKSLTALFMGRHHYLYWGWPRENAKGKIVSWRAEKLAEDLMAACAAKGPWSDVERVRGRGAWRSAKGELIVHTGEDVWIGGKPFAVGERGRYVYPKRPPIPAPWHGPIDEGINPALDLLPLFQSWQWARPDVDPILLLGWIGAAMIGGALPVRPTVFLTGDKGTGKSTLQMVLKKIFGDGLISTTNTTAAGIYQRVGQDSLSVAVDEFEGKDDNRRAKAILELARQAYSGGFMLRGGDKHVGSEFRANSAFIFSSINAPPLEPQDLSRMALLRLRRLPNDVKQLEMSDQEYANLGRMIMRRMMDQWHRFANTFETYREELKEGGHDGRGQDTFGVLLTCADMLVGPQWERLKVPLGEDLTIWRERLATAGMAEFEDAVENWRLCLSHLLTAPVDAWRNGARITVGRIVQAFHEREEHYNYSNTRDKLEQAGLTLQKPAQAGDPHWLCIPNQNPLLHSLFRGSKWAGEPGAGVWAAALRQGPRGTLWDTGQARVNGDKTKCTLIAVEALYGAGGLMADERPEHDDA